MTLMWYSNDMFHYMLKTEFVTLVGLKSPVGQLFLLDGATVKPG